MAQSNNYIVIYCKILNEKTNPWLGDKDGSKKLGEALLSILHQLVTENKNQILK